MRGSAQEIYSTQVKRVEEKIGVDLDWQHYDKISQLDINGHDLLTPATAISLAGLAFVLDGCKDLSKVHNVHKIAAGRGCDILDGKVARLLHQSSDIGGAADVLLDKYEMWRIGKAAWQQDALPKPFITYVGAKNLAHAGLTVGTAYQHPNQSFRPPVSGKLSMFGDNAAGGLLLYANAYEQEKPELGLHSSLQRLGYAGIVASLGAEAAASFTYMRRLSKNFDISDPTFLQERFEKMNKKSMASNNLLHLRDIAKLHQNISHIEDSLAA